MLKRIEDDDEKAEEVKEEEDVEGEVSSLEYLVGKGSRGRGEEGGVKNIEAGAVGAI